MSATSAFGFDRGERQQGVPDLLRVGDGPAACEVVRGALYAVPAYGRHGLSAAPFHGRAGLGRLWDIAEGGALGKVLDQEFTPVGVRVEFRRLQAAS